MDGAPEHALTAARVPRSETLVAVCPRSFSAHRGLRGLLQERYANVRFNDSGQRLIGDALVRFLDGAEKGIVGVETIDGPLLERVPHLRVIAKYGVGLDAIDLDALARHGVRLGWRPGVNATAVAELTVGFAIMLLRRLPATSRALRAGSWQAAVGRELSEATVGIIGCGHVGREVVRLLQPFRTRLLAHDIVSQPEFYEPHGVEAVGLDSLLESADVVSLHVPLTAATRNLLSADRIDRMRAGACLINTARGGLIDEQHLARRLLDGHLGGAACDVFAQEPPHGAAYGELLELPTFVASPHMAGSSERAILAMGHAAIAGLDDHRTPLECRE